MGIDSSSKPSGDASQQSESYGFDGNIDLSEVTRLLWDHKLFLFVGTGMIFALSCIYALSLPEVCDRNPYYSRKVSAV